jgi:ribosomal protein L35AE/L33A
MEAICYSETSVNFDRTTRRYNPEDVILKMILIRTKSKTHTRIQTNWVYLSQKNDWAYE